MSGARAHRRKRGTSRNRVSKIAGARDTLDGFGRDVEIDVLTFGQFSLIDMILAVLEITGPAKVDMATWTAAGYDLDQMARQVQSSAIADLRMIIDRSFVTRHPRFVKTLLDLYGEDSVRTTRTHAKFVIVRNADWNVVIRTSMNLNHNPRLEYLQICEDGDLADFYESIVDGIWAEEPSGIDGKRSVPSLSRLAGVPKQLSIAIGEPLSMGNPRTGK